MLNNDSVLSFVPLWFLLWSLNILGSFSNSFSFSNSSYNERCLCFCARDILRIFCNATPALMNSVIFACLGKSVFHVCLWKIAFLDKVSLRTWNISSHFIWGSIISAEKNSAINLIKVSLKWPGTSVLRIVEFSLYIVLLGVNLY